MSKSRDLAIIGSFSGTLVGEIKMWPTTLAPDGYLICDGSEISRTTYPNLFSVIGTTFGSGNGTSTFNLPDYRDNMPIGAGNTYNINSKGGSKDAVVVAHSHTDSGHTHNYRDLGYGGGNGNFTGSSGSWSGSGSSTSAASTSSANISTTGVSGTNANLPPYIGIHFIIRYV